jgi:hypothetical protein
MYSSQIARALSSDPYVSLSFLGVFPSDKLPESIDSFPASLVANTDPSNERGEHWVAYYFDRNGSADYFDSYGLPPCNVNLFAFLVNNGVLYECNDVQLQAFDSSVCGQYCIAFLANRARGHSMQEVVKSYQGDEPGDFDSAVANCVNKAFNIKQNSVIQHGGGGKGQQCCCSKLDCRVSRKLVHCFHNNNNLPNGHQRHQ